ncbi:MAG: hypothetical protein ACLQQ4_12885 [Bacteroidia bacterium]
MNTHSIEHHEGKKISYFLWLYVGIFSAIMLAVMVEEHFFLK